MIVAVLVVLAVGYAAAYRRARSLGRTMPRVAPAAFVAGCAIAAAATLGPIDALADASLAWHMAQHLTLAFIVAPLLLLAAPVRLALATLPARGATRVARALASLPPRVAAHPAIALLQFVAVLYVAHFSPLYEAALEHPAVHAFEHALFLGSAVVFWMPILAVAPAPHAPAHPVRILMLFLALPAGAFLGFALYVSRTVLYAHYAVRAEALADQANAGAVMWIAGGGPLFIALLWCVADWGARERRLGALADRAGASS